MTEHYSYNEKELLVQIAHGDEKAFGILYKQYWRKVYSYLESIVKSPQTAEEILIDIFVKLWLSRDQLEQIDNLGGFLKIMTRNKALDFLKKSSRDKKLVQAYRANMVFRLASAPDQRLLDDEILKIRDESLSQLSPQRRKIFLMHREEGLSHKEIAEKLQLSPTTVKKTMSEALASIHGFLQARYNNLEIYLLLIILWK